MRTNSRAARQPLINMTNGASKSYLGAAGELRAASELSLRGYVAHIPTVDEGADLWAVDHGNGIGKRIQVKTSAYPNLTKIEGFICYQISIDSAILASTDISLVIYIYAFGDWQCYVTTAPQLQALRGNSKSTTVLLVLDDQGRVTVGGKGGGLLDPYRDAWDAEFPVLEGTSALAYAA